MCQVISLSKLDRRCRDFVESFGGYGIVQEEDSLGETSTEKRGECVEEEVQLERNPIELVGELW